MKLANFFQRTLKFTRKEITKSNAVKLHKRIRLDLATIYKCKCNNLKSNKDLQQSCKLLFLNNP